MIEVIRYIENTIYFLTSFFLILLITPVFTVLLTVIAFKKCFQKNETIKLSHIDFQGVQKLLDKK